MLRKDRVAASEAGNVTTIRAAGSKVFERGEDRAAHPKTLQKLPNEILRNVLDQIRGSGTLKAWCAATNGSRTLLRHALRRYHRRFVVSRKNILYRNPRMTRRLPGRYKHDNKELLQVTKNIRINRLNSLPESARLTHCLVLNFQSGYNVGVTDQTGHDEGATDRLDLDEILYTFQGLLPYLTQTK